MIKYYVDSLEESIKIFPMIVYKKSVIYLFVYHPKLNPFKNLLVNFFPLAVIIEK